MRIIIINMDTKEKTEYVGAKEINVFEDRLKFRLFNNIKDEIVTPEDVIYIDEEDDE